MSYWFFFSYAHADQNNFLNTFYKDLADEVRTLTGAKAPESGFIDREGIEHGAQWDKTLEKALQSCRVFVPIYSPSYFLSDYCGKEIKVFLDRLVANRKGPPSAAIDPLILPVLLTSEENVLEKLPAEIKEFQYKHGKYPNEYLQEGLLQLVRLGTSTKSKYYNEYSEFVHKFADTLVKAAKKYDLPSLPTLTPLDKVDSMFSSANRAAAPKNPNDNGPRYVQFVFVAGKQSELTLQRQELKFYGQQGGADWQPYLDAYKGNVAALAIEAVGAISKDLHYEEVALSAGVIGHIQNASKKGTIVVVIVDTWTLRIENYKQLIEPLDQYSSVNCLTFIVWNNDDLETGVFQTALNAAVQGTFATKISHNDPSFNSTIKSYEDLKKKLSEAIPWAQAKVLETAEMKKKGQLATVKLPQI